MSFRQKSSHPCDRFAIHWSAWLDCAKALEIGLVDHEGACRVIGNEHKRQAHGQDRSGGVNVFCKVEIAEDRAVTEK
jgi:hypothetical protein